MSDSPELLAFFSCNYPLKLNLAITEQRTMWRKNFLKAFLVVFTVYIAMYLIRYNFKASSGMLKEQLGFSTTQLGQIGLAFSITYGIGKTVLGYFVDGKNTKRIVSALLMLSGVCVLLMGVVLSTDQHPMGFLLLLWGLSGLFQSVGGPASYATIMKWTPRQQRGRWLGLWNTSHNIGGAMAGLLALWGANYLFDGHVWGMFIVPAVIALGVGMSTLFIGHDSPEAIGMDRCEVLFDETIATDDLAAASLSKWQIFTGYILKNQWVWLLCLANIFVYVIRIGVDNWAPLYTKEMFGFNPAQQVSTLFYFEMGAFGASLSLGYLSDLMGGRRALLALISLLLMSFAILGYRYGNSPAQIYLALFCMGLLIFGPQLLIGVSVVGFVPKQAVTVANGVTGTFGYLLGDSVAKVGLAAIADPENQGLTFLGHTLHGWNDTFIVFYGALVCGAILLVIVARGEEHRLRKLINREDY
ncbi:MAG: hexose-6-phosphate:phosphate antiporter [Methylococcales bacterium]